MVVPTNRKKRDRAESDKKYSASSTATVADIDVEAAKEAMLDSILPASKGVAKKSSATKRGSSTTASGEKETAKDRVKRQRLNGQSGIGSDFREWKSETGMNLFLCNFTTLL